MNKKVEVSILNQAFTFVGDDEGRIRKVAGFVDEKIKRAVSDYGIVNTMNAIIMALMEVSDEYLEIKELVEHYEGRTLKLIRKMEEFEVPCDARDKW
jgi:cell division protein ZapA (FtsZ GTPase activity inhibitor)